MITIGELAKKYDVRTQTVLDWLEKAGIEPGFLGKASLGRRGHMAYLDDDQQKQLRDWLDKRAK